MENYIIKNVIIKYKCVWNNELSYTVCYLLLASSIYDVWI